MYPYRGIFALPEYIRRTIVIEMLVKAVFSEWAQRFRRVLLYTFLEISGRDDKDGHLGIRLPSDVLARYSAHTLFIVLDGTNFGLFPFLAELRRRDDVTRLCTTHWTFFGVARFHDIPQFVRGLAPLPNTLVRGET